MKLRGDHGGGTFKFCFQLGNVQHPNSLRNTVLFMVFAAKDIPVNLATAFKSYHDQVQSLGAQNWQGKTIQVIFFSDYELLCSVYGLSGASGACPCLFCLATKSKLQVSLSTRAGSPPRTLQGLAEDYRKFVQNGARVSRAKEFNNASGANRGHLRASIAP